MGVKKSDNARNFYLHKALRSNLKVYLDWQKQAIAEGNQKEIEYVNEEIRTTRNRLELCEIAMNKPRLSEILWITAISAIFFALWWAKYFQMYGGM